MSERYHSLTEGQHVHYLANLGGLVAISGLEDCAPDLLLGALVEVAKRLPELTQVRIKVLQEKGRTILKNRAAEKRSFRSWQRAQQSHRFDWSHTDVKKLILALGGRLPVLDKDAASELRRLVRQL